MKGFSILVIPAVALLCHSTVANAQALKRTPGDTIRFQQTAKMSQTMEGLPTGPMTNAIDSDTKIAVLFGTGDTIRVWLESAKSHVVNPMGDMTPDMSGTLNKPYVMTLGADGRVKTISAPKLLEDDPMGLGSMADDQSFGFDLPQPKDGLRPGVIWTDTVTHQPAGDAPQKLILRAISTYTVVGDTVVDGQPVVAVDVKSVTKTEGTLSVQNGAMTVAVKSEESGSGRLYYSRALGLIIKRNLISTGTGTQTIEGPMSMTINMSQKGEQGLSLIH